MGTFDSIRKKFRGFTESHQKIKSSEEPSATTKDRDKQPTTKQKLSNQTRLGSKSKKSFAKFSNKTDESKSKKIVMSSNFYETKNDVMLNQQSASYPTNQLSWKASSLHSPPTPPLHRMTSLV